MKPTLSNKVTPCKPKQWKRYIDDVFSLWDCNRKDAELFIKEANNFHPTIKFTAEISENEITSLGTIVFKGERFTGKSILFIKTHYKLTETFQYSHFASCHPRGFIKGGAIRLLRTNSSKTIFDECLAKFKQCLEARGYPKQDIERPLSEVNSDQRQIGPKKQKSKERLLTFVTTYHPAVQHLKKTLMANGSLIENQPRLETIFRRPLIISYRRGKSLRDMLVRAKM